MGQQHLYPRIPHLNSAAVSFAAGGDNTVIAAITDTRIMVHRLFIVVAGATNITIKNGSTSLTGAMPFAANGALVLDISGEPWFAVSKGSAFVVNLSAGVQVSGTVYYATSV